MSSRARAALALVLLAAPAAGQEPGPQWRLAGEASAGGGWFGLRAAGDETRYEAAWAQAELSLLPLRVATGEDRRAAPLELGPYAGLELLTFSSRSYEGERLSLGLGLELRWSDPLQLPGLSWAITFRPHATPTFERSQVSEAGGERSLETVLASFDLSASLYRVPALDAPAAGASLLLFAELHLRLGLDVDLDPARRPGAVAAGAVAAPARRQLGRGGGAAGVPPATVGPGSPALETDTRDLSRLLIEATGYLVRWDWPAVGLALGGAAGLSLTRAYYYLGLEDGERVHTAWAGPVLRVRVEGALWVIAACPVLFEVDTGRWGPTPSLSLLAAF